MKLILATNNAHKIVEIRAILGSSFGQILSLKEAGIDHETIEDGQTFLENALKKAREITEISGCCALADDSGLCVEALDGVDLKEDEVLIPISSPMIKKIDKKNKEIIIELIEGM